MVWPTWSVADAGMLSTANLTALNDADPRFDRRVPHPKAPGDLATHFHWNGDAFTDGADHRHHHPMPPPRKRLRRRG